MSRYIYRARYAGVAAIVLAAMLAAGCGGSDDDNDAGSAPVEALQQTSRGDTDASGAIARDEAQVAQQPGGRSESSADGGPLPQLLDRRLIQTTTLNVETDAVSETFQDIANIALGAGGVVFSSTFGINDDTQTASITIRVPNERYAEVLASLHRLGDVKHEQTSTNEVTAEYTDLQSRLRNLQATERQYLVLLERAASIPDILTVQDRVNATRAEIEQVQGRINLLENQSDLATLTVHLFPPAGAPAPKEDGAADTPLEVAEEAFGASLAVLTGIATVAVAVAAFSWWLVPLAGAGIYLGRRQQARAERARSQPPPGA